MPWHRVSPLVSGWNGQAHNCLWLVRIVWVGIHVVLRRTVVHCDSVTFRQPVWKSSLESVTTNWQQSFLGLLTQTRTINQPHTLTRLGSDLSHCNKNTHNCLKRAIFTITCKWKSEFWRWSERLLTLLSDILKFYRLSSFKSHRLFYLIHPICHF